MSEQPFVWCLVANVTLEPHHENQQPELRLGVKHFSPGTKLYCCPSEWGDGHHKLRVLGRHRGSPKLVEIVVATKWLMNWRAMKVYQPHVVRFMTERQMWDASEKSRLVATSLAEGLNTRTTSPALQVRSGPGGTQDTRVANPHRDD